MAKVQIFSISSAEFFLLIYFPRFSTNLSTDCHPPQSINLLIPPAMSLSTTKLLSVCAAAGLIFTAPASFAQMITLINPTTNNGSFETNTGASKIEPFPTVGSGGAATTANPVPYWAITAASAAATTDDTGIQTGVGLNEQGLYGAFEQPGASIFNLVTSRPIAAGDLYTLTFYGVDTEGGPGASTTLGVTFYSQAVPTGATYGFSGTALSTTPESLPTAGFMEYSLTFAPSAASAGADLGIELTNSGADYNGLDNFVLTVTPAAVPEPSTYAWLAAGLMGLLFLRRRVRA